MLKAFSVLLLTAGVAGAVAAPMSLTKVQWPEINEAWKSGSIYFTSDPGKGGVERAKDEGVKTIINLKTDSELTPSSSLMDWILWRQPSMDQEADEVRALGLRYEQIPLSKTAPTTAAADKFLNIMQQVDKKDVLVHCDLGGRALTMYAIYLGSVKGYSADDAIAEAEKAGLTNAGLKTFARNYILAHPFKP